MAAPVLKCPFLSQFTLQQVRASASHILNAGIEACPVFSQFARKISTSNVEVTSNLSSMSHALSLHEIKTLHEKFLDDQQSSSEVKATLSTIKRSLNTKKPNPYGESKT